MVASPRFDQSQTQASPRKSIAQQIPPPVQSSAMTPMQYSMLMAQYINSTSRGMQLPFMPRPPGGWTPSMQSNTWTPNPPMQRISSTSSTKPTRTGSLTRTRSKPYLPPPIPGPNQPMPIPANPIPAHRSSLAFVQIPTKSKGLLSNYHNRVRTGNNGMFIPVVSSKEEDVGLDSDTDSEQETTTTRRSTRAAAISNSASAQPQANAVEYQVTKRAKRYIKTNHVHYPKATIRKAAEAPETLVPIKIEIDLDGFKLKDYITWNLKDSIVSPEKFAEIMCVDLDLNVAKFGPHIALSIRQQLEEYAESVGEIGAVVADGEDARIVINLDLQLGRVWFRDRFEWDLTSSLTPEEFAKIICSDLGIGGEFLSVIATAIREQIYKYTRDRLHNAEELYALESSYRKRRKGAAGLSEVRDLSSGVFRFGEDAEYWSPSIDLMSSEDVEKTMIEKERETRRMRRETGRGNIVNKQRLNDIQRIIVQNIRLQAEQEQQFSGLQNHRIQASQGFNLSEMNEHIMGGMVPLSGFSPDYFTGVGGSGDPNKNGKRL